MAKPKQSKYPKIEIRMKEGSEGPMCGANSQVFIDGEPIKAVHSFKFEVDASGLAKVQIEMFGQFAIHGEIGRYESIIIPIKTREHEK